MRVRARAPGVLPEGEKIPASTEEVTRPSPAGAAAASAPPMDLTSPAGIGVSPPHPSWGRHSVSGASSSSRAGRPGVRPGCSVAVGRPRGGPSGRNGFHKLAALIHPTAAHSHAMLARNAIM